MVELVVGAAIGGFISLLVGLTMRVLQDRRESHRVRLERLTERYASLVAGARTMSGIASSPDWSEMNDWERQSIVQAEDSLAKLEIEQDDDVPAVVETFVAMRSAFNNMLMQRETMRTESSEYSARGLASNHASNVTVKHKELVELAKSQLQSIADELHSASSTFSFMYRDSR